MILEGQNECVGACEHRTRRQDVSGEREDVASHRREQPARPGWHAGKMVVAAGMSN